MGGEGGGHKKWHTFLFVCAGSWSDANFFQVPDVTIKIIVNETHWH